MRYNKMTDPSNSHREGLLLEKERYYEILRKSQKVRTLPYA